MSVDETTPCELCGHPKHTHRHEYPRTQCVATVYREAAGGMNAWPCPCKKFVAPPEEQP